MAQNRSMERLAYELKQAVDAYLPQLKALQEEVCSYKSSPEKWSKKEILGHLIDSAQNNIRRFIVSQYEEDTLIVYKQDEWVRVNNYQLSNLKDIVNLWYLLNSQISNILKAVFSETAQRTCKTDDRHTIEWLANDYLKHLQHHIHQVLDLEPYPYP